MYAIRSYYDIRSSVLIVLPVVQISIQLGIPAVYITGLYVDIYVESTQHTVQRNNFV